MIWVGQANTNLGLGEEIEVPPDLFFICPCTSTYFEVVIFLVAFPMM